jgi:hypothetical protein
MQGKRGISALELKRQLARISHHVSRWSKPKGDEGSFFSVE